MLSSTQSEAELRTQFPGSPYETPKLIMLQTTNSKRATVVINSRKLTRVHTGIIV